MLHYVPADTVLGQQHLDVVAGRGPRGPGAVSAAGMARLYVLSAYADLGRKAAGKLLRPLELMELGTRIGRAAATEAQGLPHPDRARSRRRTFAVACR